MKCRICAADCNEQFCALILQRYECKYYFCGNCGFLFTEEPYWLDEAYRSPIAWSDTGLVNRNINLARRVPALIFFLDGGRRKYLDAAGGYGLFTRMMRDIGFDFYWSDKYCQNLVARGFESDAVRSGFSAVTAFEVLEHVPDPVGFIGSTLEHARSRTLIFSTELFDGSPPKDDWGYYSFKNGQHVSFYQRRTLQVIAQRLGLLCHSNGFLHMITDKPMSTIAYRLSTGWGTGRCLSLIPKCLLECRIGPDEQYLLGRQ